MEAHEIQGWQMSPSYSVYPLMSQRLPAPTDPAQSLLMAWTMTVLWQHLVQTLPFIDGGTGGREEGRALPKVTHRLGADPPLEFTHTFNNYF